MQFQVDSPLIIAIIKRVSRMSSVLVDIGGDSFGLGGARRAWMHRRIGDYLESPNDAEQRLQRLRCIYGGGYGEKSVTYAWQAAAACGLEFANRRRYVSEYVLRRARHLSRADVQAALAAEVVFAQGAATSDSAVDAQLRLIGRRQHPDLGPTLPNWHALRTSVTYRCRNSRTGWIGCDEKI